jgi:hypothetical protein
LTFLLLGAVLVAAQTSVPGASFNVLPQTRDAAQQIIGDSILNGKAYEYDAHLADLIGPRLTGSSNYMRAVEWTEQQFKELGLANVHTEDWTIPATWEPEGPASGRIIEPVAHPLHIYSVGWSPSTPPGGVQGEVVYVPSFLPEALDSQKAQLKGKIALVDSASYGEKYSIASVYEGFGRLHSFSPTAILTTGIAGGGESVIAAGLGGTVSSVPEAQVGREDSLLIKRLLEQGHVIVQFSMANTIGKDVKVPNVIAEIRGSEFPNEVVIVGAHLDSWLPGTGAQDNGTGVASVLEAARAIQALHRAPRRTIRFMLFGGEEEGLLGSVAYVRQHLAELPTIDAVLVTDSGSEPAKGWYLMGREDEKGAIVAMKPLLAGLGADGVSSDNGFIFQSDHSPFDVLGVPSLVLWNDMDKYMPLHHKAGDTFDSVVEKDLAQGAAVVAVTAYAIADSKDPFAAHLSRAEMQSILQKAALLDGYNYLKSVGMLP